MRLMLKQKPKTKKKTAKTRMIALLVLLLGICIGAVSLLNMRVSPMLREVAQSELESIAVDIVGEAVYNELENGKISYNDVVNIERDEGGRVTALTTNVQKLNLLKLRILNKLSDEMFERTEDTVYIPLGNLTGFDFLTGVGPRLKFKILWVSSVDAKIRNSFDSAGINQTRHQIMLDFTINVGIMFSGREIGVDVGTSACVAETVIVGDVPKFFSGK